jgi:Tfp pilus assembly protein PilO
MVQDTLSLTSSIMEYSHQLNNPGTIKAQNGLLEEKNQELKTKIAELTAVFPTRENLSQIYNVIGDIVDKNGVSMEKITPHELQEDSLFYQMKLEFSVTSAFNSLLQFVHSLESETDIFRIEKLQIDKPEKQKDKLNIQITLLTHIKRD